MENKITINGKTFELDKMSPEFHHMLAELGVIPAVNKSVFERADFGGLYWCFARDVNEPVEILELEDSFDNNAFEHANYFRDGQIAKRLGRQFELQRRLLRYAYVTETYRPLNEIKDTVRDDMSWVIRYSPEGKDFTIWAAIEPGLNEVTFNSLHAAQEALEKVVRPFVKKYPETIEDYAQRAIEETAQPVSGKHPKFD